MLSCTNIYNAKYLRVVHTKISTNENYPLYGIQRSEYMLVWQPRYNVATKHLFLPRNLYFSHHAAEWIIPVITGIPPPPCAAFSITRVDPHRLVIFGGKQVNSRVNEIHILNLDTWVCGYKAWDEVVLIQISYISAFYLNYSDSACMNMSLFFHVCRLTPGSFPNAALEWC